MLVAKAIGGILAIEEIAELVIGWPAGSEGLWGSDIQERAGVGDSFDQANPTFLKSIIKLGLVVVVFALLCMAIWRRSSDESGARPRMRIILAMIAVGVGGTSLVISIWWFALKLTSPKLDVAAGSLDGVMFKDHGRFDFNVPFVEREHVFTLKNVTRGEVELRNIKASCSCTKASVDKMLVAPGESLEVRVVVAYKTPGRRRERAWIDLGDEVVELVVEGRAVLPYLTRSTHATIDIQSAREHLIGLVVTSEDADVDPSAADFETDLHGLHATFSGWTRVIDANPSLGAPTRWHGVMKVVVEKSVVPISSAEHIRIIVGVDRSIKIGLVGWPGPMLP